MNDNQFRIGALRDKMIGESLQAGGHVDAELVDAGEMAEVLHRAGHIGEDDIRQASTGKTVSAPNVFEQCLTPGFNITSGVNGDGAVVNELGGLNVAGEKAKEQHCRGSDHLPDILMPGRIAERNFSESRTRPTSYCRSRK